MATFKKTSTSKHGTAYYQRDGFKGNIAIPSSQFEGGTAPDTIEVGTETHTFAAKAPKATPGGIQKVLSGVTPEQRKAARAAGREAVKAALAAQGVSL